jgi:hypothetical protein
MNKKTYTIILPDSYEHYVFNSVSTSLHFSNNLSVRGLARDSFSQKQVYPFVILLSGRPNPTYQSDDGHHN